MFFQFSKEYQEAREKARLREVDWLQELFADGGLDKFQARTAEIERRWVVARDKTQPLRNRDYKRQMNLAFWGIALFFGSPVWGGALSFGLMTWLEH